jgi:cation-transporting ATPase E
MRYSLPAGIIAGVATFITYLIARHHYTGAGALDAETSAATLTLFLISMWVLAIVARPYTWGRVTLVLAMGAGFVVVLVTPSLQRYFALRLVGTEAPWAAFGVAVVASAVLEVVWRRAGAGDGPATTGETDAGPPTRDDPAPGDAVRREL